MKTVTAFDMQIDHHYVSPMGLKLTKWRRAFSIERAKTYARQRSKNDFTCAILHSGGCLDTIAAIRAGFKPIWGSEIHEQQAKMFSDLTGAQCLGDTFSKAVQTAASVQYIKSGPPCTNYSLSGDKMGAMGKTGWIFVQQADIILHHLPKAFCLEISGNTPKINNGRELSELRERLCTRYVVYGQVLKMWHYGDPSNRERLFLVGFLRTLGQIVFDFKWPVPDFCESESVPTARIIAVDDDMVPEGYWRNNTIEVKDQLQYSTVDTHKINVIAKLGNGMGYSENPHAVISWDGLLNGQTTYNGGAQRPSVNWKGGQEIHHTRLTVPIETVRAASLDDSENGYQLWTKGFVPPGVDPDVFLRLCVNNGVAQRTSFKIDECVMGILEEARTRLIAPPMKWASLAWNFQTMRKMLFDTGANGHLNFRDLDGHLSNPSKAVGNYTVANKGSLDLGVQGKLAMIVFNSAKSCNATEQSKLEIVTTTADISCELFSFDPFYKLGGWGCDISPWDETNPAANLYKMTDKGKLTVPLMYDWQRGGFWLHYLVADSDCLEHRALLAAHQSDMQIIADAGKDMSVPIYDSSAAKLCQQKATQSGDVVDVIIAQHEDDRVLRGTKAGLKSKQQKMTIKDFHEHYGHMGCDHQKVGESCLICTLVKGAARKIFRKVDPHRETRPGYKWHMDTVTWSHRSGKGNKYMTVLRCEACDFYVIFCHYLKSDIRGMFERWIHAVRKDPAFNNVAYKIASILCLDNAGEWARECEIFKTMLEDMGIQPIYSCPDRKESAALAERSVGIVEIVTKALLMQNSLPTCN